MTIRPALWREHPGVRTDGDLTLGERAADRLRNGMGSWAFVFGAIGFLGVWMLINRGSGFDPYPFILLNLVLSCVAALQGAILLIAAKRSDQISSELAKHDYEADLASKQLLETMQNDFHALQQQHTVQGEQLARALRMLEVLVPLQTGGVIEPGNAYTVGQGPAPLILPRQDGDTP